MAASAWSLEADRGRGRGGRQPRRGRAACSEALILAGWEDNGRGRPAALLAASTSKFCFPATATPLAILYRNNRAAARHGGCSDGRDHLVQFKKNQPAGD